MTDSDNMSSKTGGLANTSAAALIFIAIVLSGCHKIIEPSSSINMADPSTTVQLLSGFYPLEGNSWRWVARNFSVALKPPPDPRQNGARLTVHLYLPELVIETVGSLTLTATLDGKSLGSQVYDQAGSFDFIQNLSHEEIDTNILPVQFCFDKSVPPGVADERDLAAVITGISLAARQAR